MSDNATRRRWWIIAVAWVVTVVLGWVGWQQQADAVGIERSVLDTAYAVLLLFTVNFPLDTPEVGWALQVARFAAPIVTASALLQAAAVLFRRQIELARLGRWEGHAVVCGLGEKGRRLAGAVAATGGRVAGIEAEPSVPGVATVRAEGGAVVEGDARESDALRKARVDRADLVVVTTGDDATAMDVAAAARRLMKPGSRLAVHLTDARLCELLRAEALRSAGDGPRLELFNILVSGARQWMAAHPPFAPGERDALVAIVGLGPLGEALAVAALQRWSATVPLRLAVVDPEATDRWRGLAFHNPAAAARADSHCIDLDFEAPDPAAAARFEGVLADPALGSVHVALDGDTLAVSTAIWIHHRLGGRAVPIVVRTAREGGLAAVLRRDDGSAAFDGLHPFSLIDQTCTLGALDGGPLEALARALHDDYLSRAGSGAFAVPWDDLPDEAQESNRAAADEMYGPLFAAGYDLVPTARGDEAVAPFPPEAVDALASREHERWRAERIAGGWTYGPQRDDEAKHNPLLRPWAELPDEARASGRAGANNLPGLLARSGFRVVRRGAS